uniref:DUF834 domain-containing protein n=1 Tax=Oryza meridionalis TaxID=40149 RepID=A0A0E0EY21_9ORYZ
MAVVLTHGVVDEGCGERRWGRIWLVAEEAGKEAARRGEGGKRKTRRWSRRVAEESRTTPSASGGGGDAVQLDGELKLNFLEKKPRVASGK